MDEPVSSVTFAMTGGLNGNGRAIRQVGLLEELVDRVHVIAADAENVTGRFSQRVKLHPYDMPPRGGWRFFWMLHRRVRRIAERLHTSVYHASDLYVLPALSRVATRREAALVYDARELYPFVQGTARRPWATFFWSQVEGRFVPQADLVMTVNESIAEKIVETYGIRRPTVLPNVPNHGSVEPSSHLRDHVPAAQSDLLVLHLGHMKEGRGCATLIKAIALSEGVQGVFLGDGPDKPRLQEMIRSLDLSDRVTFLPPVPYESVLDVTAGADVGVSLLEDTCLNHWLALPNKLFEYLHAGVPVVVSDFPEIGRIVKQYEVGLTADPSSPESVAKAIQTMRDDPNERSRWRRNTVRVREDYGWSRVARRMTSAYRKVLS